MSTDRPEPPDDVERREHPRVRAELRARVRGPEGEAADATTVDISEGGVLLGGDDFPSGTEVIVEIELAELGWHALDAEVVRRREEGEGADHLAARFADVATRGGRDAIRAFLEARLEAAGEDEAR